jgi:hypothetical protein
VLVKNLTDSVAMSESVKRMIPTIICVREKLKKEALVIGRILA